MHYRKPQALAASITGLPIGDEYRLILQNRDGQSSDNDELIIVFVELGNHYTSAFNRGPDQTHEECRSLIDMRIEKGFLGETSTAKDNVKAIRRIYI